jgi:hypothetical protein
MNALVRVSAACLLAVCTVAMSGPPKWMTEELMLPTSEAGISIYIREGT